MKLSWRQDAFPLAIVAAMFAAAAWSWSRVPDRIPIHWNAAGEIDGYGGRFMGLLLVPLIALGCYALFFVLPMFDPGKQNYASFQAAYHAIRNALVGFFGLLYAGTIAAAHGRQFNMTTLIMPALGVMFIILGNVMSKIRPNHFVGIRTPWTLSSKLSWNKTHRLGGWLFVAEGLLFILVGLAAPKLLLPVVLGSTLAMLCVLFPYSYHIYSKDPERITPAGVSPAKDGEE